MYLETRQSAFHNGFAGSMTVYESHESLSGRMHTVYLDIWQAALHNSVAGSMTAYESHDSLSGRMNPM